MGEVRVSWVSRQEGRSLAEGLRVGCSGGRSAVRVQRWGTSAFVEKAPWAPRLDVREPAAGLGSHRRAPGLVQHPLRPWAPLGQSFPPGPCPQPKAEA